MELFLLPKMFCVLRNPGAWAGAVDQWYHMPCMHRVQANKARPKQNKISEQYAYVQLPVHFMLIVLISSALDNYFSTASNCSKWLTPNFRLSVSLWHILHRKYLRHVYSMP